MKVRKRLLLAAVFMTVTVCMSERAYASEPYEKIANSNEWEVLKIVNEERMDQGLEPLSIFSSLQKAAGVRAEEITGYFSHTRPDGTSCFTAIDEQEIKRWGAGENIAAGYASPASVMNGWMNSSGHRANILRESYSHIGVGYCTGSGYGKYWTQLFISGCNVKSVTADDKGTANYPAGTAIDHMNRYLIVRCSDHGVSYIPVTATMCKGYNANKTGHQTITVSFQGKKVKIPVTIGKASTYSKPETVTNLDAKNVTEDAISLEWDRKSGKGYEIWLATGKNEPYKKVKTLTSANKTSYNIKDLKSGKKYYFKVRAYKKVKNKKIYGLFSKAVVVKTK